MTKIFCSLLFLLSIAMFFNKIHCYDEMKLVPDPYLDVVFQLDQSGSFESFMYKEIFESLIEWIKSYLDRDGSSISQFAAILCCDNVHLCGIRYYFNQKNYADGISAIFSAPKQRGGYDNWQGCTNEAVDVVFTEPLGHRLNVSNIAIFVTDCAFHMEGGTANASYILAAKKFINHVKGRFVFICAKDKDTHGYAFNDTGRLVTNKTLGQGFKENILMLLSLNNQNESSIIYHVPNMSIIPAMDEIMPKRQIGIFNCKWNSTCSECLMEGNSGNCFKYCNNTIYQLNGPRDYGIRCPPLTDERVPCNCTDNSDVPVVESSSSLKIVLGVLGGLFLIAILLVILLFFIRKRRQRKQRESRSTQSIEGEGKQKGLSVEIQMLPVGTSQGVQSKEGPEKKKGVGVQIEVSKGAKTKTMSKSVSFEKLDKSPMKKDAKSTSKTVSAEVHGKSPVKNPPISKGSKK